MYKEEKGDSNQQEPMTLEFPIQYLYGIDQMKNNRSSTLPNFHSMVSEDPDKILFEFDVIL
jgi:hypothetical protein